MEGAGQVGADRGERGAGHRRAGGDDRGPARDRAVAGQVVEGGAEAAPDTVADHRGARAPPDGERDEEPAVVGRAGEADGHGACPAPAALLADELQGATVTKRGDQADSFARPF